MSTSDHLIDMSAVYALRDPLGTKAFRGEIPAEVDPFRLIRAEELPASLIEVRHASGASLYDVIWTTSTVPIILRDHVVERLSQSGISGWTTYPVEIVTSSGERSTDYAGLAVRGRAGPIDDSLSEVVEAVFPGGRTRRLRGRYFDPSTWDGSDLFVPHGTGYVFATARVRDLFQALNVSNISLVPVSDIETKAAR